MKMSFAMPSLSFASQLALLTLQASYKAVKVVIRLSKTIKVKICCIYFLEILHKIPISSL